MSFAIGALIALGALGAPLAPTERTSSTGAHRSFRLAQAPAGAQQTPPQGQAQQNDQKKDQKKDQKDSESGQGKIDYFQIGMGALAGLVLFLYGVTRLAEGMEKLASDRLKDILGKVTTNRFLGVLSGAAATTVLESSSVTIIMVIALVSAGLLTFVQSLGVVLGSNIGTAIGSQLVAFEIHAYAPIALAIGALLQFLGRSDQQKSLGLVIFGFGLLFFGLDTLEEAMKPFRKYQPFLDWMVSLGKNPLLGVLVGALFTVAIQSSSATVAVVITLSLSGLLTLSTGIVLMLGAEVGTCADTLVATLGRGRPALRTGLFHLLFNVGCAAVGVALAPQLADLAAWLSGQGASVGRQIATAQMIFNVVGVVAVIFFLPAIAAALEKLLPDDPSDQLAEETPPQSEGTSS